MLLEQRLAKYLHRQTLLQIYNLRLIKNNFNKESKNSEKIMKNYLKMSLKYNLKKLEVSYYCQLDKMP